MDAETKRRIDNARDTLVGKVTDPKGQVEQITIALTYKFMDDMDLQAVRLGGKRTFFADNFEPYAWSNLMDPAVNALHMHRLYSDGIDRMSENPGAAPLFRTIFDNAFLPYNDPQTLQQFLRIINEFEYGNSEALGDAYEYLTSIMGSQGDAGQFRTPRHIIDFIVDIVNPQIGETILDPACGTGGFLISAYKHITAANSDADGSQTLTPGQLGRLADSLTGYDIDPGMVRIALLNMYLHGLVDPHIHEYDTLTSEEHWNRYADVIIANPPFMTPKGGIRPHSKFSVQSKRSEVLFVDYMAEHLTTNGRAGIIVPEGIIFQTQNAHKQLRKMLVDDYLAAVISLPGGVFNPYSGVKTSILILDKALARKSASIGFFKVTNDGYDLGAQRRPIDKDDLPKVRADLQEYLRRARAGDRTSNWQPETGHLVPRDKIATDGEYNLSGERYKVRTVRSAKWPMVRLGDLVTPVQPPVKIPKTEFNPEGKFPIIDQSQSAVAGFTNDESALVQVDRPLVIFGDHTCEVKLAKEPFAQGADGVKLLSSDERILPDFLYHLLRCRPIEKRGYRRHFSLLKDHAIPLPTLDVQHEIIKEIETYQRVIDGARMVVENWRPRIEVDPAWPVVELGEVCEVIAGQSPPGGSYNTAGDGEPFYQGKSEFNEVFIGAPTRWTTDPRRFAIPNDILMSVRAPVGPVNLTAKRICIGRGLAAIRPLNGKVDHDFVFFALKSNEGEVVGSGGTAFDSISIKAVKQLPFPLPPSATQRNIAQQLAQEQRAADANRELIASMEARVRDAVARVWS